MKYGKLTVLEEVYVKPKRWRCRCDCGNVKVIRAAHIKDGKTKSCGCIVRTRNGDYNHPLFPRWKSMHVRCYNPSDRNFHNYGGRGIQVCARWFTFQNFVSDMGERPARFTIERDNTDGHYMPSNCRWASWTEQENNRKNNHLVEIDGKTQTLAKWCKETGINYVTAWSRIKRGWTERAALFTPLAWRNPPGLSDWLRERDRIQNERDLEEQEWIMVETLQHTDQ